MLDFRWPGYTAWNMSLCAEPKAKLTKKSKKTLFASIKSRIEGEEI